jgi:two-component system chemotaxis sensor kinase CheA
MIDLSLLEDFVAGAGESLQEMETALLQLNTEPNNHELLNTIFRAIHTIKGAAQFVGLENTAALSHALEDLLDLLREQKKLATAEIIACLIQGKDRINLLVADLERSQTEDTAVDDLIIQLNGYLADQPPVEIINNLPEIAINNPTELSLDSLLVDNEEEALDLFLANDDETSDDITDFLIGASEDTDSLLLATEDQLTALSSAEENKLTLPTDNNANQHNIVDNDDDQDFILPNEEHDLELFGIFKAQLQEKVIILNQCLIGLDTETDKNQQLEILVNTLNDLKFSANYMAYDPLTELYINWINQVLTVQKDIGINKEVSFAFMTHYLRKLQTIFPELDIIDRQTTIYEQDESQTTGVLPTNKNEAFDNKKVLGDDQSLQHKKITDIKQTVEKNATHRKDALFDRLSSAMDVSLLEQSITAEPINEVFSALLDSTESKKSIKTTQDQSLVLKVKTLEEANKEPPKIIEQPLNTKAVSPLTPRSNNTPDSTPTTKPETVFKKSIRVDTDKINDLMNQVGELIVDRAYFFQLVTEIYELQRSLKIAGVAQKDLKLVRKFSYRFSEAILSLGRTSNELQEGVMKIRMLPMAQIFNRFPRLVHDVAQTNNKKVHLDIRGEETELDKMLIEEISDPLMHMIRNAIDHGIELPEQRIKIGKAETGNLILEAYHESNHIVIEVVDDGRGIDLDRIKQKAQQMELFSEDELARMSDNDLTRFIMMPGFSTTEAVSSTSGRGVGMDVVMKNIEKLNGTIDIDSKKGIGTKIRLKIPLTLAIIPALLVRVGGDSFTIPLANVEETLRVQQSDISIMEETEVMYLRGKTVPIFRLASLFSLTADQKLANSDFFVVIVKTGAQKIGLMVDALIGQEEVVIKSLADYLHEQNCFSGATIIGDGRISLILDIHELVKMTTNKQIAMHHKQEKGHWQH